MILLLDLHQRPFSPEAPKSRNFVDQVFVVFGEHGNYSTGDGEGGNRPLMEGGREAWRMLWRLRKKAYEKAGVKVPEAGEVGGDNDGTKGVSLGESHGCSSYTPYAMDAVTSPPPPVPTPQPPPDAEPTMPLPTPAAAGSVPIGGSYEELLQMDTIIDAEDKAFFTGKVLTHFLEEGQALGIDIGLDVFGLGVPGADARTGQEAQAGVPQGNLFSPTVGGVDGVAAGVRGGGSGGAEDMMDFDWEEWDQVFGKYVSVDVGDVQ